MRMVAILKNDDHPEYGEVSMPLPIKASEYSHCMELLSSLSIGDALNKDCKVEELCLEGCKVNIDELDYLAKRLDGFDAVEVSQFQAIQCLELILMEPQHDLNGAAHWDTPYSAAWQAFVCCRYWVRGIGYLCDGEDSTADWTNEDPGSKNQTFSSCLPPMS